MGNWAIHKKPIPYLASKWQTRKEPKSTSYRCSIKEHLLLLTTCCRRSPVPDPPKRCLGVPRPPPVSMSLAAHTNLGRLAGLDIRREEVWGQATQIRPDGIYLSQLLRQRQRSNHHRLR